MSAAERIHDKLPEFRFGLWGECPETATIAWGARGIADRGAGFGLLPDRQTMAGLDVLREPFSKLVLNKGPLEQANLMAKRLRSGWTPYKDLSRQAFTRYYWDHYNKLKEDRDKESFEEGIFQGSKNLMLSEDSDPLDRANFDRLIRNPRNLYEALESEQRRLDLYYKRCEERDMEEERNPPSPPPPPAECENEECGAKFRKVKKDEYTNCCLDFDCWLCDDCGEVHSFDWPEDESNPHPGRSVIRTFESLIGQVHQRMFSDKGELFTLFDDFHLKILGNTNGSHGYVYIVAFPKHQIVNFDTLKPSGEHPGFENGNGKTRAASGDIFWSGDNPPPMPGEEVSITCNNIGKALVFGHVVIHNYLHLNVLPLAPPEFYLDNVKGGENSMLTNVTGSEIG